MTPKGFLFSTAEAAIKYPGRKDLALIYSNNEAVIAAAFTTNKVKAAPVKLDIKKAASGKGQAIIVNSGNANACTGKQGLKDASLTADMVASELRINPELVYVCSTGVIGTPMPMERIRTRIPELIDNLGISSMKDVARAIMTTDTFPKIVHKKVKVGSRTGCVAGICKGAGMICPNMATMLCFILTDIAVEHKTLGRILVEAVRQSFNRITVDGDMSTNDTVIVMANGTTGNRPITGKSEAYQQFRKSVHDITYELSKMIVKDGEGASKLIAIEVKGARNEKDAGTAAFAVANSNLVKTAVYGNDPNWGRILAALGYSGATVKEENIDVFFGKLKVVNRGVTTGSDEEAAGIMKEKELKITINLNLGKASFNVLTCDLTEEYVKENATYKT